MATPPKKRASTRKVRTTIDPSRELEVDQAEHERLREQGLLLPDNVPVRVASERVDGGPGTALAVRAGASLAAGRMGATGGPTHQIQTTMRPDQTITVSDDEYQELLAMGLVYSGSPVSPAADEWDLLFADKIDSGTATPARLRAAFDARANTKATYFPGSGRAATIDTHPGAFFFGANLGYGPTSASSTDGWTTDWNWSFVQKKIDRMGQLGMNAIRVNGSYAAYTQDPAAYKTKFTQVMEECRKSGLKVIYGLLNQFNDTLSSTLRSNYKAMAADLCGAYAGDTLMIGWDIGNELNCEGTADINTLAQNLATDLRAIDPTTKITCSGIGYMTELNSAHVQTVDSYVDFHDVHMYVVPGSTPGSNFAPWQPNWLDDIRRVTSKPFIIGEYGANRNATQHADPHLPDDWAHAHFYRAVRRYSVEGVMGLLCWEVADEGTNQFGLYDDSWNPRPALGEVLGLPSTRLDVVKDVLGYRTSPVVLHNFARADSSTDIGNAPIGGAAAVTAGTWGIASRKGKVITPVSGNQNLIAWEANSCDVFAEVEFIPGSPTLAGLALRVVDAGNFIDVSLDSGSGVVNVHKFTAGSNTLLASMGGGSLIDLARIGVHLYGNGLSVYAYDHFIGVVDLSSVTDAVATGTKHGLYQYTGIDTTTKFQRFSVQVAARTY